MNLLAKLRSATRSIIIAVALAPLAAGAAETGWHPTKRVEIIVPSSTGGGNDRIGRLIQRIMTEHHITDAVTSVVNKPGAGMALGMAYMNQHPGNGHYLLITSVGFLTNAITGRSQYSQKDVTPVALLFEEYVGFGVLPNSKFKTGKDLAAALKADTGSVTFSMASAAGNHNHLALAKVTQQVGSNLKKLKIVAYGSGGKAMTAMLGGHVDVVVAPAATLLAQAKQGLLKMIAISAPKRQEGALATVPTWREQGVNAVMSNWRVILAPQDTPPEQVKYWEDALAQVVKTPEWKEMLEKTVVTANFMRSAETRKFLDAEYEELQGTLDALGLVKKR
jgi:putative tricarboxylic transport membrane protein